MKSITASFTGRLSTILLAMTLIMGITTAARATVTWQYTSSQHFPPSAAGNWGWCYTDNVGFDLLGYARDYASLRRGDRNSVKVFLAAQNAYGWKMKYYVPSSRSWVTHGFKMLDVAQWQARRNGYRDVRNWGVYYRNFHHPSSWRGAYWMSGAGCR